MLRYRFSAGSRLTLLWSAAAAFLALGLAGAGKAADSGALLELERVIPLPDVRGRVDHLAVDLGRKRLIVAELGNGTVDIVDLASDARVHRIEGLSDPQGVGYAAGPDVIAVANAGDGSVRLFRGGDFSAVGTVDLDSDADNVRLDPRSGYFIVGHGAGGLAIIDPVHATAVADIRLPAHPEGFQLDPANDRVFVNIPDAREIAVVGLAAGAQVAKMQVPGVRANFPMAVDPEGAFLATVFRSPARILLIETRRSIVVANAETCGDADDVFYDARRVRFYVSCGSGDLDVFARDAAGLHRIARLQTGSGARTALYVPELDRLYVAARAGWLGSTASILVFRPGP